MAGSNKPNKSCLQELSNNSFPILPDVNKLHVFAQSTAGFFRKIQIHWNQLVQNMKANHRFLCCGPYLPKPPKQKTWKFARVHIF